MATVGSSSMIIERITPNIGAEIRGVDLTGPIDDNVAAALRAALYRHKVIFFRGQHRMTDELQAGFAARLGPVIEVGHPTHGGKQGRPSVSELDSEDKVTRTDRWHTDTTFIAEVPGGAVLRAVLLPSCGGDTMWANTAQAYEDMPGHLKTFAEQAWGVHSNRWGYAHSRMVEGDLPPTEEQNEFGATGFSGKAFEAIHPLVRVHPFTGERALLAGNHLRFIRGLTGPASEEMKRILQDYVLRPENSVRWRWQAGDVAVWDNRATQHYALRDYAERRLMHRISLVGEVPVGVDGQTGYARVGGTAPAVPPPAHVPAAPPIRTAH